MDRADYDSLTPMERNCLRLAHHDCKSEQIAHTLGIATSTVNTHVFAARRKLGGIPRLVAADELRAYEAAVAVRRVSEAADTPRAPSPQSMSSPPLTMADGPSRPPLMAPPTEVREERTTFVFDDVASTPGEQGRPSVAPYERMVMILAIAVLAALVLIAAPAIYDSAAQRVANSLERPHAR